MRKFAIVLVLLVMGLSAGAYIYYYKPFATSSPMETMLPGDTLGMIRICQLNKQINRFSEGKLGRALAGIDWTRLMTLTDIPPNIQEEIRMNLANLKTIIQSPLFDSLFGEDMTMAMLNTNLNPDLLKQGDIKGLLDAMVAVTRPKHPAAIFDHLTSIFDKQLSRETHPYKQWDIVTIGLGPDLALHYALNRELMIAALSDVPVKRCLDQIEDVRSSLAEAPQYKKLGKGLFVKGETDGQMYINADLIFSKLTEVAGREAEHDPELMALKTQLEQMKGVESMHWVQYDDGSPVIRTTVLVGIDIDRQSPKLMKTMGFSPSANPTIAKAPLNALFYSWQNNFDLKSLWEEVIANPQLKQEDVERIKQSFAMETGMAIEDFIDLFGHQFGLILNDVKKSPMFPIPELALFLQVENPDKVNELISAMAEKQGISLSRDQYKGMDIRQVMLPMGDDLSPTLTLSDGFLTVAINRSLLETMLDTTSSSCILTHPNITALGNDLTSNSNQVFFIRFKEVCEKSKDLIAWGLTLMAITNPEQAKKLNDIMNLGIFPLLDGFAMYQSMGGRMVIEDSVVKSEMRILMDRG